MSEQGMTKAPDVVTFQADSKPLFRASDRAAMQKSFDLWSLADVSSHGAQIAEKLEAGTMPCDGPWPADHVALSTEWLSSGCQP